MKRQYIPASAIYHIIAARGPIEVDAIGLCSRIPTLRSISELRADGKVFVSGWRETSPGHYRMLLSAGSGPDVPMPRMPHEEKLRRNREYQRRRAAELKPKVAAPQPTLPTYHPRLGVWGI